LPSGNGKEKRKQQFIQINKSSSPTDLILPDIKSPLHDHGAFSFVSILPNLLSFMILIE
jgi:hypothetical protein